MLAGVPAIPHCVRSRFLIRLTRRLFWGAVGDGPTNVVGGSQGHFLVFSEVRGLPGLYFPTPKPVPHASGHSLLGLFSGSAVWQLPVLVCGFSTRVRFALWTCERGMAWIPPHSNTPHHNAGLLAWILLSLATHFSSKCTMRGSRPFVRSNRGLRIWVFPMPLANPDFVAPEEMPLFPPAQPVYDTTEGLRSWAETMEFHSVGMHFLLSERSPRREYGGCPPEEHYGPRRARRFSATRCELGCLAPDFGTPVVILTSALHKDQIRPKFVGCLSNSSHQVRIIVPVVSSRNDRD